MERLIAPLCQHVPGTFLCGVLSVCVLFFSPFTGFSQTGPGGVGTTDGTSTLNGWWKGDAGVTSSSGSVSAWADQSGYAHHLSQGNAGNRPTTITSTVLNSKPAIRYVGAGSQYFASSFSGPGVSNMTLFLVANGSAYQSLFRFQVANGTSVVYPWDQGGGTFITSSDGGTGAGVSTGLVTGANNVGAARYRRNTTNGMQTFLNGGVNAQRNSINAVLPNITFYSGRYFAGTEYATAEVGEMILYYSALNDAQMVIVQNYLAARYNVALTSNDVYTMDNSGNGDYDFNVAGIGRVDASNIHNDAQGTGTVRILTPSNLDNNEFLIWGDNGIAATTLITTDVPSGVASRLSRVWRVSEANASGTAVDVGTVDIRFDLTGLSGLAAPELRLLVDTDNDNSFADETPIAGATSVSGNIYQFTGVSQIENNLRFTLTTTAVSTYYSLGSGAWGSNTSWSLSSDGSSGPLPVGVFPGRKDNVVIRTGHNITVDNVADNGYAGVKPDDLAQANIGPFGASNLPMFYQTGNILINGTLTVSGVEVMLNGYTHILSGGTLLTGSNLVVTGNLEADTGSTLTTLDDIVLTGYSITIINTTSTSSDDIIIDHTDATLCGTGSTVLQNGSGSSITYSNGGTISQVCTTFTVACTGIGCAGTFPTIGTTVVISGNTGPAGIGATDGTSSLTLWLDATKISGANNAVITSWSDLSGRGFNFTAGNGAVLKTNFVNGQSALQFNGTSNYFERAYTAGLNPTSLSIFSTNNVTSSAAYKTIISSRKSGPTGGYMLYSIPTSNNWSFWNGNALGSSWDQLNISNSNAGSWALQTAIYKSSSNTKSLSFNNNTEVTQTPTFQLNTVNNTRVGAGLNEGAPLYFFNGSIGEVIVYGSAVNESQAFIINNYLSAKYGFTLSANDIYTMDNAGVNFDFEVFGIGRHTNGTYHRDAKGTGIVRVWNPRNLGTNEYLLIGHNNATLNSSTVVVGTAVDGTVIKERLNRIWGVSETGDAGIVSVSFDLGSFPSTFVGSNLRLLVDRNGDGFQDNDVTPLTGSFINNTVVFDFNFNTGDRFTLGNTSSSAALPIELIDFTASANGNSVLVQWKTMTEINNDYFQVYRSNDGEHWNEVAHLPGAGNSNGLRSYEVTDHEPLQGKNYYQLKQTDYDGHYTYSKIVLANVELINGVIASPNPSTGIFSLSNIDRKNDHIRVLDIMGRDVSSVVIDNEQLQIDISAQPAGVYILRVYGKESTQTIRIVKN